MSEKEFRLTTPRYFHFRQKGFESVMRDFWQMARVEAFYSFLPHTKKGALKSPEKLFRLSGESPLPEYNEQQKAALIEHLKKVEGLDLFNGESIKAQA